MTVSNLWLLIITLTKVTLHGERLGFGLNLHLSCNKWHVKWSCTFPHAWMGKTEEPVQSSSLPPWIMMCFALLQPLETLGWVSTSPLQPCHPPPFPSTHSHTQTEALHFSLSLYCRSSPRPLLPCSPPYSSASCDSAPSLSLSLWSSSYAFVFTFPVTVTVIGLPHFFLPSGRSTDSTALSTFLFCQIAKLATVFNHLHPAKSHEVIKNFKIRQLTCKD